MTTETESPTLPDPAAIFTLALSLWHACRKIASEERLNLGASYHGMDQFTRELMRVANQFEEWACSNIDFNEMKDVWSYLMEDQFGSACLAVVAPTELAQFNDRDCLRVALRLRLTVILDQKLPIPIDVSAPNPVAGSPFRAFRIQTVRDSNEDGEPNPYSREDDPFDAEFGHPYFGLYGVAADGKLEHIADRRTYSEALCLAHSVAPGIAFPSSPASFAAPVPE